MTTASASGGSTEVPLDESSGWGRMSRLEAWCVQLPYLKPVTFKSTYETSGSYVIVRLTLDDGTYGLAEAICRPDVWGEDAETLAAMVIRLFETRLRNRAPPGPGDLASILDGSGASRSALALLDVALWDIRGRKLQKPVWNLLGVDAPRPVPLTWIAHGASSEAMVAEAEQQVSRGFFGVKLKTWRRSMADVEMVADARRRLGPDQLIYVDANSSYSEAEAREILVHMADYGVRFLEDPCKFADIASQANFAGSVPVPVLADRGGLEIGVVQQLLDAGAAGAITLHMRHSGITGSLAIIDSCARAGAVPVIGTDSESRIGALARMHLHASQSPLHSVPPETHFFAKLADDAFRGTFDFRDGRVHLDDTPGIGAELDPGKLARYTVRALESA